jgi:hypothetical protein
MAENDYPVGYKRPPLTSRFQPGQSGNPQGRPKGLKNLATDLKEELEQKILVTEGGQSKEITKQRAMVKTMMAKALKGDSRAALALIQLTLGLEQSESGQPDQAGLEEEDLAIIENFKARMRGTNPVPPEDPADADKN